jgi:hypothetical protein
MLDFTDIAVFIGMLFLRIGVPALVVIGVGYLLKRLDARWEAEARAYQAKVASEQPAEQPPAPQPSRRPGKQPATPQPLPFIPPQPVTKEQRPGLYAQAGVAPAAGLSAASKHCWDEKGCSEGKKAKCAAPSHPDQPCWQARFNAEGHVPEECVTCDIFQRYPSM